ncbi:MAG: helix-turn-helix domain-containing protein [Polyangiaceae bacterium]
MKPRLEQVLARRIRELASARGMPISHVADRCGMAHSYFWRLLNAKASATLSVVQRLADALEVEPLALLGGPPAGTPTAGRSRHARVSRAAAEPRGRRSKPGGVP